MTGIDYPTGTPDVTYGYDKTGLRTSMVDGVGSVTYTYNDRGQMSGAVRTGASPTSVGYGYDAAGRQTSITYPGTSHTVTRGYDNADRLTSVTDWANRTTNYTWYDDDTVNVITLPNGVTSTYTRDDTNLSTKILTVKGTTTISDQRYTYDTAALQMASQDATVTGSPVNHGYTFDSRTRLDAATGTTNAGDYDFDAANRLTKALGATYSYDTAGQLTASTNPAVGATPASSASYGYNTRGDRTTTTTTPSGGSATTKTYGYDGTDHLTSYTDTKTAGLSVAYTYDGDGLRTRKTRTSGGTTTSQDYTWNTSGQTNGSSLPLMLLDSSNYYLYGPDGHPYAQIAATGGAVTYLHPDNNGNTIAATDTTGTRTGTWEYDAYGNTTKTTGTASTPYLYAGEYRDTDTGLTYLRARDYDPATGNFTTRDPLEDLTATPYTYTDSNPLQGADPAGLFTIGDAARFAHDHWRGIAKVGVVVGVGIAAGACVAATAGLCAGAGLLMTGTILATIGATGGVIDYALTDTCDHTIGGYLKNAAIGAALTVGGEAVGYAGAKAISAAAPRVAERLGGILGSDRGALGGSGRLTSSQAAQMADRVGFRPTNYTSRSQRVFSDGRRYITQDIDSHSGGTWKMADSVEGLRRKSTRLGTFDHDLNLVGP